MLGNFYEVIAALVLVGVALAISWYEKIGAEKDILVGTFRSFIQLIAIGYALEIIFDLNNPWLVILTLVIMILVGGHTAQRRTKSGSKGFVIALFSIGIGTFLTLGLMLFLRIISFQPKYVIPLAGMTVGNCMNAAALALDRLDAEIKSRKNQIEVALALGATSKVAIQNSYRITIRTALMPITNLMKIVGLVQLPGAMVGMILAGANPLSAVKLQIIVVYMLMGACSITAVLVTKLAQRGYFTKYHQLIENLT